MIAELDFSLAFFFFLLLYVKTSGNTFGCAARPTAEHGKKKGMQVHCEMTSNAASSLSCFEIPHVSLL